VVADIVFAIAIMNTTLMIIFLMGIKFIKYFHICSDQKRRILFSKPEPFIMTF
jgi:hypothetical protein